VSFVVRTGEKVCFEVIFKGLMSTVTSQQKYSGFDSHLGPFSEYVGSLQILWLPLTVRNEHVWLSSYSKLTVRVSVSVHGYLSCLSLCWSCDGLVTCPGCTQGVPCANTSSPNLINLLNISF